MQYLKDILSNSKDARRTVDRKKVLQYKKERGIKPLHFGLRIQLLVHLLVLHCCSATSKQTIPNVQRATVTASELVNVMEKRDHKHGKLNYFEIYARQHGTCVKFSHKSAVIS